MNNENVDISEFSFSSLPACGFYEVLGKRGTGKTSWTKYILQFSKYATVGIFTVMCGSETVRAAWGDVVHPMYLHDPSIQFLKTIHADRNAVLKAHRKKKTSPMDVEHMTLILDDVASNKKIMRSPELAYLASNSRHLHMTVFLLAQYHCQIPAEIRSQNDYLFMLTTVDKKTIKRIYEEYVSMCDLRVFKAVVTYCTADRGLLVINNQCIGNTLSDVCYSARISNYSTLQIPTMGPSELWEFADRRYIDDDIVLPPLPPPDDESCTPEGLCPDAPDQQKIKSTHRTFRDTKGVINIRSV